MALILPDCGDYHSAEDGVSARAPKTSVCSACVQACRADPFLPSVINTIPLPSGPIIGLGATTVDDQMKIFYAI